MAAPALWAVTQLVVNHLRIWKGLMCRTSADTNDSPYGVLMMRVNIRLVYGVKFGPACRVEDSASELPF